MKNQPEATIKQMQLQNALDKHKEQIYFQYHALKHVDEIIGTLNNPEFRQLMRRLMTPIES